MGIQVQPVCCDEHAIYTSGYQKFLGQSRPKKKWLSTAGFNVSNDQYGWDIDILGGHLFRSSVKGQVRRIRLSDGLDDALIASFTPNDSTHRLNNIRVFPTAGILLLEDWINSSSTVNLRSIALDGSATSVIYSFTFTGSGASPMSSCLNAVVNLSLSKVVFLETKRTGTNIHDVNLRQCNLDGSNVETLLFLGTYGVLQDWALVLDDVDYNGGQYFISEQFGLISDTSQHALGVNGVRYIHVCDWSGGNYRTVLSTSDIASYLTQPRAGLASVAFTAGQTTSKDGWFWFIGLSFTNAGGIESAVFSMRRDGSDLKVQFLETDFNPDPSFGDSNHEMVLGAGFNDRRGRQG